MSAFYKLVCLILLSLPICSAQLACNSSLCLCSLGFCTNCISTVFFLNSNINSCQICDYRCSTCSNNQQCKTCSSGYFLDSSTNSTGIVCKECPLFCNQCNNQTFCNKCLSGYVSVNGVCKPCSVPNVLTCDSEMSVSLCQPSYWKNGDSCSSCRQFCQSCTSSTNCLTCQDGFRVEVSAGTYCAPCSTGCKTCSSATVCTNCLINYRLISGGCLSLLKQCMAIQNCQQCLYSSSGVICKVCVYPYYLSSQGKCILGSSLLCSMGSGGLSRYQCLNSCGYNSNQMDSLGNQYVCAPKLWIPFSDIKQHYLESLSSWDEFIEQNPPYSSCGNSISVIYSSRFINGVNIVSFNKVFTPYYKLIISVKALPLYKKVFQQAQISFVVRMKDNSSSVQQFAQTINATDHFQCQPTYFTMQSKLIKDQNVTISFQSSLNLSTIGNLSQLDFPQGLMGFSQILIQLYRCSPECRICSNSKYCMECYGNLFAYQNQCVEQCYGFYQFYSPTGNPLNYTYKSCLQKCPDRFYSELNQNQTGAYICALCKPPCSACKSQKQCLSCISPYLFYDLEFSCVLVCPSTHYNSSRTQTCAPCNSPCRTCFNQTACSSCSIGFYYSINSSCISFCPTKYYSNISSRNCEKCDQKCISCSNSPTNCLACQTNYYLLGNGCLSSCPALTHFPLNNKCEICRAPCLQCTDQLKCINCLTGYLLNSWCYTSCPQGYYGNFTSNTCQRCPDSNCMRCTSSTICQVCSNSTYLSSSKCLTSCPSKTYPSTDVIQNIGNICVLCIQPCLECLNSTYCLSCQIGYMSKISSGKCVIICQVGYYPTELIVNVSSVLGLRKVCQNCSPECLSCKNNATCLSCVDLNKVLTNDYKCVDFCPPGYYNHSRICELCNYPCLTCSNTSQICLSCYQPYILSGQLCVSQCGVTEYQKQQKCYPCISPCKTCLNDTHCTSCQLENNNQTYLWLNSCIASCPISAYEDPITLKCKTCNYPCATCIDSKKCLTCATGYLNPIKQTCQICTQTFFPNQTTKQCQPCNSTLQNCRICSSSTFCRYCETSFFLYNGKCVSKDQCQQVKNYYVNTQQMACLQCISPCGQCLSQNLCITCTTGYLLHNKCLLQCPTGYYASINSNSCQLCNLNICLTCNLASSKCLSCNVTSTRPILMPSLETCIPISDCPSQFYVDQSYGYGRCIKCQPPCLTCSSSRTCTSCLSGILYNGQCKTYCPISFYQSQLSNSSAKCLACSNNCLKCRNDPNFCVSCSQDKFLQGSSCVQSCSDGYYLDPSTLQCKNCSSPCKTCTSGSFCLSCLQQDPNGKNLTNRIVYYGQCLSLCPDGSYINNQTCIKCPLDCQLCGTKQLNNISQVYCKKCREGLFMNSSYFGQCQIQCRIDQYSDIYTRSCYTCQQPCVTCLSATTCTSCQLGYLLYKNDCIKGNFCPENTFKATQSNQSVCLDSCVVPLYGDNFLRECVLNCPYNFVKFNPTVLCVSQCPSGYYLSENSICQNCKQSKNDCNSLLKMNIRAKSIFNNLFVRINFNSQISMGVIKSYQNQSNTQLIRVQYRNLHQIYQSRRLLEASNKFNYQIVPITSTNTIWLKMQPLSSLGSIQINVALGGHYLFTGKTLQNANSSITLMGFDLYNQQEIKNGQGFETFANVVSSVMCILFLINLIFNTGYLMYPMVDLYQLLFLLLFLNIDYPPALNYFLFGFKYSHYLFLPQIFDTGKPTNTAINTPDKFGIIVPDANFLNNTGHDFLIMFIVIGLLAFLKLFDLIYMRLTKNVIRSNKIKNQKENSNQINNLEINSQNGENKSDKKSENLQKNQESSSSENSNNQEQNQTIINKVSLRIKAILDRARWNYFNDFLYIMYFYLMLFAFCQTYSVNLDQGFYASTVFAILFIVLGISWPIGLTIMLLYKNEKNQIFKLESDNQNREYYLQYKCYVANLKPKNTNISGLLNSPIRYIKKLILSALFAYCSNYENFIMGVIIMLGVVSIIINLVYRPFKNKLQNFANCLFEAIFCLGCICLCVLMFSELDLTKQNKKGLAITTVVIFLLLSLILVLYNCAMIVLQCIQYFTNKNYLQKFNEPTSQSSQFQRQQQKQQAKSEHPSVQQNSNLRLNISLKSRKQSYDGLINGKNAKNGEESSDNTGQSGLGIYLQQNINKSKTPQLLIKCIKGGNFKQSDSQQQKSQIEEEKDSQIDSDYKKIDYTRKYFQKESDSDEPSKKSERIQQNSQQGQQLNIFENQRKVNEVQEIQEGQSLDIKNTLEISDVDFGEINQIQQGQSIKKDEEKEKNCPDQKKQNNYSSQEN